MSLLQLKDLDRKLADLLDFKDLKSLNILNKYFYNLLDNNYFNLRFKREYFVFFYQYI